MRNKCSPAADRSASTGALPCSSACPASPDAPRTRLTWAASTANDNASRPMSQAGLIAAARNPASAGPMTIEAEVLELTSALAASRCSGGSSPASSEYFHGRRARLLSRWP